MEPLTLQPEPREVADASNFYRDLAEELQQLARLNAEISWTPDVPLRAKRTVEPRPAATGRLPPRPRRPPPAQAAPPVQVAAAAPPRVARQVEVAQQVRPGQRRPQQGRGRKALQGPRILRLGRKPEEKPAGQKDLQLKPPQAKETRAAVVQTEEARPMAEVAVMTEQEATPRSASKELPPTRVLGEQALPEAVPEASEAPEVAFADSPMSRQLEEIEVEEAPPAAPPERPKAKLLEVLDLHLFLPKAPAPRLQTVQQQPELREEAQAWQMQQPEPRELAPTASPRSALVQRAPEPKPQEAEWRRPLHGLILDVIDEMSQPPAYQEPAEVQGGCELAPIFGQAPKRSKPAPRDEDSCGRRLGRAPPPYEVGPPPPYDGPGPAATEAQEKLQRKLQKKQEELEEKEKALAMSQARAEEQVRQLASLQQQAQEQSLALAQAQATLQAQVQSQRQEAQHLIEAVQQSAKLQCAEASQQLKELQERLAPRVPESDELQQRMQRMEGLLEGRLCETLRAMATQSEERAAYVAALSERPQVVPMAPPPPPKVRVSTSAQTDVETKKRKDHEAKVARFTHYLLHGVPGPEPRPVRDAHAEAMLVLSLKEPKVISETSGKASSSSGTLDAPEERVLTERSSGEVFEAGSPGELRSDGETSGEASEAGSEGEVRHKAASRGEVSHGELQGSEVSSGEVSSFAT